MSTPQADSSGAVAPVAVERVGAALRESVSRWSALARTELVASDRLWIAFSCRSCGALFDRVFRLPDTPWNGGVAPPAYRECAELGPLVERARSERPAFVDASEWKSAAECACRAPHHHRQVVGAALLHSVLASGASLVVACLSAGEVSFARVADGSGELEPLDPSRLREAFGRPLTLFEPWGELASKLPLRAGTVIGSPADPGVWLFAASSEAELAMAIGAKLGAARRITVRLDRRTVTSEGWPASLAPIARAIEEKSAALALVVERDALARQARAWALGRCAATVRESDEPVWALVTEKGEWPFEPARVALAMAQRGRTLPEACAHELHECVLAIEDRIETLRALTELVPGSSFDVEGTTAIARLPDGRAARSLDLVHIPAGAGALSPEMLAREAAFFFDVAPPWADRARVCACGAAASLERKLVPWPWRGEPRERPRVVRVWGDEQEPRAAEVVAISCDRHVRVPSDRELDAMRIDGEVLARRLDADLASSAPPIHAVIWHGSEGERVVVARGPLASSVILSDGRVRALEDRLGAPIGAARALGWAVGSDVLAISAVREDADAIVRAALHDCGVSGPEPFWIRREIDLSVSPLGTFDVVVERR